MFPKVFMPFSGLARSDDPTIRQIRFFYYIELRDEVNEVTKRFFLFKSKH